MIRKISILLLLTLYCRLSDASCIGQPPSDIGWFEVIANKNATVACEGKTNGTLKFAGCILEVRMKSQTQTIRVYSTQKEICDFQPKQNIEMYVNTACCGVSTEKIRCSDFPNGDFGQSPHNDAYGSCDATNARYIHRYRREVDGKPTIRYYNESKKAFEDTKIQNIRDSLRPIKAKK